MLSRRAGVILFILKILLILSKNTPRIPRIPHEVSNLVHIFDQPPLQSATFQTFTVLSVPEEANRFPSGLNATPPVPL
jgi:hypothetical protein